MRPKDRRLKLEIELRLHISVLNTIVQIIRTAPLAHDVSDPILRLITAQAQRQVDAHQAAVQGARIEPADRPAEPGMVQ